MNLFSRLLVLATLIGGASLATGCATRTVVGFDDHDKYPVTAMRASYRKTNLFFTTFEYQFYSCSESGDKLVCKRLCGGTTDLECPKAVATSSGGATNVR